MTPDASILAEPVKSSSTSNEYLHSRRELTGLLLAIPVFFSSSSWAFANDAGCTTEGGTFEGEVISKWLGDGRTMQLEQQFAYVDGCKQRWVAPKGAIINGASIPRFLWTIMGGPFEGRYRNASIVHDWYCSVRTYSHEGTHRMFYDAMLTSGVPTTQAKLLYYGVCLGGPRWDGLTIANSRLASQGDMVVLHNTAPATTLRIVEPASEQGRFAKSLDQLDLTELAPEQVASRALFARRKLVQRLRGATQDGNSFEEIPYT